MRIVEVAGKDSEEFLQRVTAGSVKNISAGTGRAGLLLTGQSRVIAQFDLLKKTEDHFLLVAPRACAEKLAQGLEALHFTENLEITLTENTAGVRAAKSSRKENEPFLVPQNGEELCWPSPVPGFECSTSAKGFPASWDFARIAALVPWPGFEWEDGQTPALEAGMLPWIDRFKGCYPGQEVVELSLNVGHPARVLIAVEGPNAFSLGTKIPWDTAEAFVTSAAKEAGRARAILRVPWARKDFNAASLTRLQSHW